MTKDKDRGPVAAPALDSQALRKPCSRCTSTAIAEQQNKTPVGQKVDFPWAIKLTFARSNERHQHGYLAEELAFVMDSALEAN